MDNRPGHAQPTDTATTHQHTTPHIHPQQHGREHTSTLTQHTRARERLMDIPTERGEQRTTRPPTTTQHLQSA
eukprot:10335212-Prorocentrum_lima.AAC.1